MALFERANQRHAIHYLALAAAALKSGNDALLAREQANIAIAVAYLNRRIVAGGPPKRRKGRR